MHTDPAQVREFFAARAANWETRYPDDAPAYEAAVSAMRLRYGMTVLDAGCGTGRALPFLRADVGPDGLVIGADLTPEMLAAAAGKGRHRYGALLLADVARLPLCDGGVDAVFAAASSAISPTLAPPCASWPGSPGPAVCSHCSTPSAARRWPPARGAN